MRRVVVTGLGAITPLGVGVKRTWTRLLAGDSGITLASLTSPKFANLPSRIAGLVPTSGTKDQGAWNVDDYMPPAESRKMARFAQYAMAATQEALADSGYTAITEQQRRRTGVYIGSGIGNLSDMYDTSVAYAGAEGQLPGQHDDMAGTGKGYKKVSPLFVPRLLINLAAGHISMKYGLQGPNHAATTACTTGAHALGDAARMIQFGDADVMIAGGAESCVHPLAIAGFARARSLATSFNERPEEGSRPFDKAREGFVIAEGAGVVVLEELSHALARKAPIYAELSGYGLSSDAHHMTAPRADGLGPYLAMQNALRHARIAPKNVDYINAHATSTPLGDASENRAITDLLCGEEGKAHAESINVSSTKGAIGHLLGAAGAVEAIFAILALKNNIMPPTLNLDQPDEGFKCNYIPRHAQERVCDVALTNSFGFGGTNASLCFTKFKG